MRLLMASMVSAVWLVVGLTSFGTAYAEEKEIATGNKPSTFNFRINPYVRHNEFENDGSTTDYSVFLMTPVKWPWADDGAFVIEGPVARDNRFEDVNYLPPEMRQDETGTGDFVLRLPSAYKPFMGAGLQWAPLFIPEVTIPTGSDGVSSETLIGSPGGGVVMKNPNNPSWWVALVQFYDFDMAKSSGQPDINRIRLRWFWQWMVNPKERIYIMPEFQSVIDFETDEENFWIAPEFGKVISPPAPGKTGFVVYGKPGFGVNNEDNSFDREWSVEVGVRWMWSSFPLGN